jgi:hypothetical protein
VIAAADSIESRLLRCDCLLDQLGRTEALMTKRDGVSDLARLPTPGPHDATYRFDDPHADLYIRGLPPKRLNRDSFLGQFLQTSRRGSAGVDTHEEARRRAGCCLRF